MFFPNVNVPENLAGGRLHLPVLPTLTFTLVPCYKQKMILSPTPNPTVVAAPKDENLGAPSKEVTLQYWCWARKVSGSNDQEQLLLQIG